MKTKLLILLILSFVVGANTAAAQKNKKPKRKPAATKTVLKPRESNVKPSAPTGGFIILHNDGQSAVEEPFVFVARTGETYALLQKLVPNLPTANSINFQTTAVVAVFAGAKPTAGYEIVFSQTANGLKIDLTAPPADAMSAQVLTEPVSVAAVAVEEEAGLTLDLAAHWLTKANVYRVVSGKLEASGGFAGTGEKFNLNGTIKVLRAGNLATAVFDLRAIGKTDKNKIFETASGVVEAGKITLSRVDAGTLIASPRPPLLATGKISDTELSLIFEPLPTNVADGFQGRGSVEAKR